MSKYNINQKDAAILYAIHTGMEKLPELENEHLISLLREVMKMADSISNNCKDWIVLAVKGEGLDEDKYKEKLTPPTVMGVLAETVLLPNAECSGKCKSCAFTKGTPANQTLQTLYDIQFCLDGGHKFLCHNDPAREKICAGFLNIIDN